MAHGGTELTEFYFKTIRPTEVPTAQGATEISHIGS